MAKKDFETTENEDRQGKDKTTTVPDKDSTPLETGKKTVVKNASAAGLGAIGRNDQTDEAPSEGR